MKILTLLTAILIISCNCFGQNKIGNITLTDSLFKAYIFDCYKHPDSVKSMEYSYSHPGFYEITESMQRHDKEADLFNEYLEKNNIGTVKGYYLIPRKPSEIDFIKWFNKKHK